MAPRDKRKPETISDDRLRRLSVLYGQGRSGLTRQMAVELLALRRLVAKLAKRLRDSDHWPDCADRRLIPNYIVDQVLSGRLPMPPTPPCICGKDALLAEAKAQEPRS
jgi:hypothetical protein